jgi:hypothetical protein
MATAITPVRKLRVVRRTISTSFGPRMMPLPIQTGGSPVQDRPIRPVYHVINRQKAARSGAF